MATALIPNTGAPGEQCEVRLSSYIHIRTLHQECLLLVAMDEETVV